MNYSLITEEQLEKRFRVAPEKIKNLLESEKVQMEVARICEQNHLDTERALIVSQLTGLVLLGFVSERMVSLELGEQAHMNFLHSNEIAKELSGKIFALVEEELKEIYRPIAENANENDTNIRMNANDTNREEEEEMEIAINKETGDLIDARIKEGEEEKLKGENEGGVDNWIKKLKGQEDQPILLYEEKAEEKKKEAAKFSLPFGLFAKKATAPLIPLKAEIESGDGGRKTIGEIVGKEQESGKVERLKNITLTTRTDTNNANKSDTNIRMNANDTNKDQESRKVERLKEDQERGKSFNFIQGKIGGLVGKEKGKEKRVVHYSGARTPILAYEEDIFQDTNKNDTNIQMNANDTNKDQESRKVEKLKEDQESRKVEKLKGEEGLRIKDKEREGGGESRGVEGLNNATQITRMHANDANKNEEKKEEDEKDDGKGEFKGKIQKPKPMMMGNTVYLK